MDAHALSRCIRILGRIQDNVVAEAAILGALAQQRDDRQAAGATVRLMEIVTRLHASVELLASARERTT